MAHINPAFVIAPSELAVSNDQDHYSGKYLKGFRTLDPEGSPTPPSKWKEVKMLLRSKWKWSWLLNTVILLALGVFIAILEFDLIPFRSLGYECNDPNLSHKFRGDTIRFGYLVAVSIVVPLVTIFIVEFAVVNSIYHRPWKRNLFQIMFWYGQFFLGLLVLLLLTQLGKSLIGEPRPHFFDTCKPDKFNCTGYVTDYECTNEDLPESIVRDSSKSFPSGHSALGVYIAVFMVWFLQSRVPYNEYLLVLFFQCLFLSWGLLCSLTRITDHRHHWWDVLVGSILGGLMAVFTVKIFCKNFRTYNLKLRRPDKNLNERDSNTNSIYRKMFGKSSSSDQADERELREVK